MIDPNGSSSSMRLPSDATPLPAGHMDPAALARRIMQLKDENAALEARLRVSEEARLRAEAEARRNAPCDELTGLHTRRSFLMLADLAWKLARRSTMRCALMYADVDGLGAINESKGRAAGDEVLRNVARVLRQTLRDEDVVARVGGDEFAVFGHAGEGSASMLISRLHEAVAQFNQETKAEIPVNLAVGAVDLQWSGSVTIETLLAEAERAMSRGRRRRKDRNHFNT